MFIYVASLKYTTYSCNYRSDFKHPGEADIEPGFASYPRCLAERKDVVLIIDADLCDDPLALIDFFCLDPIASVLADIFAQWSSIGSLNAPLGRLFSVQ